MMTIVTPLIGGVLIGLSSSILLKSIGRIAGISGIFESLLGVYKSENAWRYAFMGGLLVGGLIMYVAFPQYFNYEFKASPIKIIIAGLLVGYGTRLGGGCTSGHGVCGIPRFSTRSILGTVLFMITGIITVYLEGVLS